MLDKLVLLKEKKEGKKGGELRVWSLLNDLKVHNLARVIDFI